MACQKHTDALKIPTWTYFVLVNQKSRQNAKYVIKKDFLKLMKNANFGFYCRNNANNVTFEPIIDKINEIFYIKKYYSPFDTKVSGFVIAIY